MNAKSICSPAVAWLALSAAPLAHGQDPAVVAPEFYICTFENEHARVCEVTFKPGTTIPSHSHPQHLIHGVSAGKVRIFKAGAEPVDIDLAPGQTLWVPAETHYATNIGTTELKALVVEFRDLKK